MTLAQLSIEYTLTADAIAQRITQLSKEEALATSPIVKHALHQRIAALKPLLQDTRTTAAIMAHYYSRRPVR